jgi:ABC-type transport system involved in Fe-S cluster assembly fused permease/ATPase subunit
MVGKTVIVVAHRLSTVAGLDRTLVFDAGVIVEASQLVDRAIMQYTLPRASWRCSYDDGARR